MPFHPAPPLPRRFAELMPFRPTDERTLHFELQPTSPGDVSSEQLLDRANAMR